MRDDSRALVSVIVPIYNVEKFLDQCLSSIEAQTHENIEVLCINDGSTDGSRDIICAHAQRDPRVRLVDKKNGGYGEGCNMGLELAKGDWISIIEPDDWIEPGMYADMLAFAARFDEVIDIVKTPWTDICDWDKPKKQRPRASTMTGSVKTSERPFTIAEQTKLIEMHPSIWSAIYRRGFLNEKNISFIPFPGAGWADNPFLIETMCQASAIVYLDRPYYNYRCDLKGSTRNHKTADAITRPFDRWIDMMGVIARLGITDERVLKAHYLRGFNYTFGAIYDDGWDNPLVKEGARRVFSMMRPELVVEIDDLAPHRKKFFYDVMGLPLPKFSRVPWGRHLIEQVGGTIRREGPFAILRKAKRVILPEEPSHA